MRPDDQTNQAFLYCLGEAAERFGIELLGWLAMSNHYHAVVHDPQGKLPEFACHFHQMLAKALNARFSRWENFWSCEPPTYTLLVEPADVFAKLIYVLLNPVTAHLTDSVLDWPGASSWSLHEGRELVVSRPKFFFREDGPMPKTVTLRTTVPPHVSATARDWHRRLRAAVEDAELELRNHRLTNGISLLGRNAVRRTSAFDAPTTPAPRRNLRPFIACKNMWSRLAALDALDRFRIAYRHAREAFVRGARDVLFPPGTFALRRFGALCAARVDDVFHTPPGGALRANAAY